MTSVERMEVLISSVLKVGVVLSAVLILLGLTILVATGDTSYPQGVMDMDWLIWGDPFFSPSHIIFLGFLTLIATPVMRIAASIVVYLEMRDRSFVMITSLVLIILIVSFTLGIG